MPTNQINLLPKDDFERTSVGKFLIWALTVGRWIVVFTELVVILAFLSRFKLDQDLSDLYDSIREKQAVVAAYTPFETSFLLTQKKVTEIKNLSDKQIGIPLLFESISGITPPGITIKNISTDGSGQTSITGIAINENSLGSFINNIATSPRFKSIIISNLTKGSGNAEINFNMNFKFIK